MATLEESIKTVIDFLRSNDGRMLMNEQMLNKFNRTMDMMISHIKIMNQDKCIEKYDSTEIKECIDYITAVYVEQPLSSKIGNFMKNYADLVNNWNRNLLKDKTLEIRSSAVIRYIDSFFTSADTIHLLRILINRGRAMQNWTPPSFELSSHYFNILKDELTKDKQ